MNPQKLENESFLVKGRLYRKGKEVG